MLSTKLTLCQINVEGFSKAKSEYLQKFLVENQIDILAVQETHTENSEQLLSRGTIPNFDLIGATYHKHYGVATYVKHNIDNVELHSTSDTDNIHQVVVKVGEMFITNVYKPPSIPWPTEVLQTYPHPAIYIGDFNSHHETWKYPKNDENGELLINWSEQNNTYLLFDVKDLPTFHSAAWRRGYNPDLCFLSTNEKREPLHATRKVHSQLSTKIPWNYTR
ncbi:hypothetical protein WDU94_005435 [Cyamophila willieti]